MVHNFMMPPKGKSSITLQRAGEEGVSPRCWGEGSLILSDIRRLGPFLGVQILNFNIFLLTGREVQKDVYLFFLFFFFGGGAGDMMTLWAFWGAIAKLDYFWALFLNLRFRYRIGIFWGGC